MRQLVPLFLFSLAALPCQAQFGVQVGGALTGVSLSQNGENVDRDSKFHYNVGVHYRFLKVGGLKKLDVQPSLQYFVKGGSDRFSPNLSVSEVVTSLRYVELSVPLIVRFSLAEAYNCSFNVGAGPYTALLVSTNAYAVPLSKGSGNVPVDFKTGFSSTDDIKPLDMGLTSYASIKIDNFSFALSYDVGLLNVSPKPAEKAYNRSFNILFCYLFR